MKPARTQLYSPFSLLLTCLLLQGCNDQNDNSEIQTFSEQLSTQAWQDDEQIINGQIVRTTWSFTIEGNFTKQADIKNANGGTQQQTAVGTFTIPNTLTTKSGQTGFNVDLTFVNDDNDASLELQTLFLQNNSLYFGQLNIIPTCEGDHYLVERIEITINGGQVVGFETIEECYTYPNELDFDHPYFKLAL